MRTSPKDNPNLFIDRPAAALRRQQRPHARSASLVQHTSGKAVPEAARQSSTDAASYLEVDAP